METRNRTTAKNMLRNAICFILGMILAVVLVLCVGCDFGFDSTGDGSDNQSQTTVKKEKLTITDVSMEVDYSEYLGYSVKILGTAKNESGKNYSYASVEYTIYDEEGNNLGTALDNINHLANGDTWKFEAVLLGTPKTRPSTYKLVEITTLNEW